MEGKVDFIRHSERDLLFFVNLWEAFKILRRERPQVILSTGAGCVVPFALLGRLLFGTRVVYIETLTRLEVPSLTGRIMYYLANHFFYQTKGLKQFFPRAEYQGTLL
jgi:UDP-N-acetylglucosamine:LPS N-acetylglucosamine transferase